MRRWQNHWLMKIQLSHQGLESNIDRPVLEGFRSDHGVMFPCKNICTKLRTCLQLASQQWLVECKPTAYHIWIFARYSFSRGHVMRNHISVVAWAPHLKNISFGMPHPDPILRFEKHQDCNVTVSRKKNGTTTSKKDHLVRSTFTTWTSTCTSPILRVWRFFARSLEKLRFHPVAVSADHITWWSFCRLRTRLSTHNLCFRYL